MLIINKTALAPYVGADLGVMERDAKQQREERPFTFCDLKSREGLAAVIDWLEQECFFALSQQG